MLEHTVKFLVVDDNELIRNLLCSLLRNTYPNCQIWEACNGREGLIIAQEVMPHLIFVDFRMPLMDGYEMAFVLHLLPSTHQIPLFLSNSPHRTDPNVVALAQICRSTLAKPFCRQDVSTIFEQFITPGKGVWKF